MQSALKALDIQGRTVQEPLPLKGLGTWTFEPRILQGTRRTLWHRKYGTFWLRFHLSLHRTHQRLWTLTLLLYRTHSHWRVFTLGILGVWLTEGSEYSDSLGWGCTWHTGSAGWGHTDPCAFLDSNLRICSHARSKTRIFFYQQDSLKFCAICLNLSINKLSNNLHTTIQYWQTASAINKVVVFWKLDTK